MRNWLKMIVLGVEIIIFTFVVYFLTFGIVDLFTKLLWVTLFETSIFYYLDYSQYFENFLIILSVAMFGFFIWKINKIIFTKLEHFQINLVFSEILFTCLLLVELYRDIRLFIKEPDWLINENGSPIVILLIIYSLFTIIGFHLYKKHKSILGK